MSAISEKCSMSYAPILLWRKWDESFILMAAEFDSFDGLKVPERCTGTSLVNQFQPCQDTVSLFILCKLSLSRLYSYSNYLPVIIILMTFSAWITILNERKVFLVILTHISSFGFWVCVSPWWRRSSRMSGSWGTSDANSLKMLFKTM